VSLGWLAVGIGLAALGAYLVAMALFAKSIYLLPYGKRTTGDYERFGSDGAWRAPIRAERIAGVVAGLVFVGIGALWLANG